MKFVKKNSKENNDLISCLYSYILGRLWNSRIMESPSFQTLKNPARELVTFLSCVAYKCMGDRYNYLCNTGGFIILSEEISLY